MYHFRTLIAAFQDLFFPPVCACCQRALKEGEEMLCVPCLLTLPYTNFHFLPDNSAKERFKGRVPIRKATSFLYFSKQGRAQQLIHQLKYHGKKELGAYLGGLFAATLTSSQWLGGIDLILPIPLHPKKKRRRGYNQSLLIARGLSGYSKIAIAPDHTVIKTMHHESQTKKSGLERLRNVRGTFRLCEPSLISGNNILLVDDVLTTGATMEACALEVLSGKPKSISIATLAYAGDV